MRLRLLAALTVLVCVCPTHADELRGTYVEARDCQVYTGPCFANGETGLMGKRAVMGWQLSEGSFAGESLKGLHVAVVVKASNTLAFKGLADAKQKQALIIVDRRATPQQQTALANFARQETGLTQAEVRQVLVKPIKLSFDRVELTASLSVEKMIQLKTRKARPSDCICSNESAYYPPLVKLQGSVPGVTLDGTIKARRLGTRWSMPGDRSAYLGIFDSRDATKLALR